MSYACHLSLKLVYSDELFSQQFPYANFENNKRLYLYHNTLQAIMVYIECIDNHDSQ